MSLTLADATRMVAGTIAVLKIPMDRLMLRRAHPKAPHIASTPKNGQTYRYSSLAGGGNNQTWPSYVTHRGHLRTPREYDRFPPLSWFNLEPATTLEPNICMGGTGTVQYPERTPKPEANDTGRPSADGAVTGRDGGSGARAFVTGRVRRGFG
jgi:hypothetical protein